MLAEGAAELAGFGEAAISVRRGDGMEVIATAGLGTSEMIGTALPIEVLDAELAKADHWGARGSSRTSGSATRCWSTATSPRRR